MNRSFLSLAAACAVIACAAVSSAQAELSGRDRFPQLRGLSGLSGGGFGVTKEGLPRFSGAMTYTTPIGHTMGGFSIAAGFGLVSIDRSLRFGGLSDKGTTDGNGTGFAIGGADLGTSGRIAFGFTFLSGIGDSVSSLQFSPNLEGKFQLAVGCQDLGGSAGSSGEGRVGDSDSSRSFYGAVTTEVAEGVFVTAGAGTRRWQKGFGSISGQISPRFKAVVEHDGWNFNYGLAFNPGPLRKIDAWDERKVRSAEITMFVGVIQSRYAGWSLVASF